MHIYSKLAGGELLLGAEEKEHLLSMIERFKSGFFVTVHEFAIMSNHFHLVISEGGQDAHNATKEDLLERYRNIYGHNAEPPIGRQLASGRFIPDPDGGLERLRRRLGSVSSFIQEIKQRFTLWYNLKHKRKGYLWGGRFGASLVERGDAALVTGGYLNLNPVRAKIAKTPDEYRWCGLGLRARDRKRAQRLLTPMPVQPGERLLNEAEYRLFVYRYGGKNIPDKGSISFQQVAEVEVHCGRIGILDLTRYRIRNLSEGFALGSQEFISLIQKKTENPAVKVQRIRQGLALYCTRNFS